MPSLLREGAELSEAGGFYRTEKREPNPSESARRADPPPLSRGGKKKNHTIDIVSMVWS